MTRDELVIHVAKALVRSRNCFQPSSDCEHGHCECTLFMLESAPFAIAAIHDVLSHPTAAMFNAGSRAIRAMDAKAIRTVDPEAVFLAMLKASALAK